MNKIIYYSKGTKDIALPKWPAFCVVGERVTEAQAAEILIKTDLHLPDFRYASNDKQFDEALSAMFNVPYEVDYKDIDATQEHYTKREKLMNVLGKLDIEYLANAQIVSSWIGGPHGWCNWNGDIFCNNFNIGKWPEVKEVAEEWARIAKAFPFLTLKCQLMDKESGEDHPAPVVSFTVNEGNVLVHKPKHILVPPVFDMQGMVMGMMNPGRERGITLDTLAEKIRMIYGESIPQY